METGPQTPGDEIEKIALEFGADSKKSDYENKPENEDSYFCLDNAAGIFDGMGGYAGGAIASSMASDYIREKLKKIPINASAAEVEENLKIIFAEAHESIHAKSQLDINLRNMGTTADVVFFVRGKDSKRRVIIGHIGDSRVYILRKNGRLEHATVDDNGSSIIPNLNTATRKEDIAPEYRALWNHRAVIDCALGFDELSLKLYNLEVEEGDVVLLCSDGVSDNLTDPEIGIVLKREGMAQSLSEQLVRDAQFRSREKSFRSKPDDMTAVVVKVSMRQNA